MERQTTMAGMIEIDGSQGEGGGQVLRTALALSLATRTPFRIGSIRGRRAKPGLLRQHLTAIRAAAAIGRARVDGDELGSATLTFEPETVESGDYTFAVGTAGSATLVLQSILPPLLLATGRTTLALEGGTHNPAAPPFDFVQRVFLPIVNRLGPRLEATLERHGFYPAGGGRFVVTIDPAPQLSSLTLVDRGEIVGRRIRALVANLPSHIGEREMTTAMRLLNWGESTARLETVRDAVGPGNVILIEIEGEQAAELCTGFGETGTTAEAVAARAVQAVRRYLTASVPVGCHLADQLLPILALGAGGTFRTMALSQHALTNAEIVRLFTGAAITAASEGRDVVRVDVTPK